MIPLIVLVSLAIPNRQVRKAMRGRSCKPRPEKILLIFQQVTYQSPQTQYPASQ
jgi:hypothetical protein